MHDPQCGDPLLATALEGHFIGNHGTQPHSDTVEEGSLISPSPAIQACQFKVETEHLL